MNDLPLLIPQFVESLRADSTLRSFQFVEEYPQTLRKHPLLQTTVSVGIGKLELESDTLGPYRGVNRQTGQTVRSQACKIRLNFSFFIPRNAAPGTAAQAFALLAQALLARQALLFRVLKIERGELTSKADLLILEAFADLSVLVEVGE